MKTLSQFSACALIVTTFFASCSRPVARYQPMPVERFRSEQTVAVAEATPVEAVAAATVAEATPAPGASVAPVTAAVATAAPLTAAAQLKGAEQKVAEAMARNENKLADNKKLARRMERVRTMLTEASARAEAAAASPEKVASPKKANLMERLMLKKMDKQIKNSLAPNDTKASKAVSGLTRLGIIIAVIGLILLFLPGVGWLGSIAIVVGLVLILLDLLDAV